MRNSTVIGRIAVIAAVAIALVAVVVIVLSGGSSYQVKATFANEKLRLWPGQFVNIRLLLTTRKNGLVVTAQVVQRGPRGAFAFVIGDEDKVEARPIKVAQVSHGLYGVDGILVALRQRGQVLGDVVVAFAGDIEHPFVPS